jgi:hypothetical protein
VLYPESEFPAKDPSIVIIGIVDKITMQIQVIKCCL